MTHMQEVDKKLNITGSNHMKSVKEQTNQSLNNKKIDLNQECIIQNKFKHSLLQAAINQNMSQELPQASEVSLHTKDISKNSLDASKKQEKKGRNSALSRNVIQKGGKKSIKVQNILCILFMLIY